MEAQFMSSALRHTWDGELADLNYAYGYAKRNTPEL